MNTRRKVLASGPLDAEILICGEAPGFEEERVGQPFIGASGQELTRMLAEAGIARQRCRVTNVTGYRPPSNEIDAFFPNKTEAKGRADVTWIANRACTPEIVEGLDDLTKEIERCKPRLIIALGSTSLWALTGESGITSWRGSMMNSSGSVLPWTLPETHSTTPFRILPTYHPAAVLRQWSLRSVAVHDLRKAARHVKSPTWPVREQSFMTTPTLNDALVEIARLRAAQAPIAVDIETTGRNISLIALTSSASQAMCLPFMTREAEDNCYWNAEEEHAVIDALRGLLEDRTCGVIGQNFHYDAQFLLRHWGIYPHVVDDTMWMQHVLFPGTPKSLDYLASMYCEPYAYWKDELKDYRRLPDDEQMFRVYNCKDVCYTYEIWQKLKPTLAKMGLAEQYAFQMSLFNPVLDMMVRGIKVDLAKRAALKKQVAERLVELEAFLESLVGTHVGCDPRKASKWYRSPQQMQRLFYEEMSFKPILNRKTQRPTVDEEALAKIAGQQPLLHPLCDALIEYAALDTFNTTFLEAGVDPDSRMRCSYNVAGTETYRFSSSQNVFGSGLNLQNLPRTGGAINIRSMFVPDEGKVILDFDLSSADLRVVVKEAGAVRLQQMLDNGRDVYSALASECFNEQIEGKKHPKRQTFKNVAHALDYVAGARTVAATYSLPLGDVERLKTWYFHNNPEIPQWHTRVDRELRSSRRIRNRFGYQRTYFDRVETLLSSATAWIGQSTVAVTINRGLVRLWRTLPQVEILLQVHDSLVVQIAASDFTPETVEQIRSCLLIPIPYATPLVIPVDCKWSDKSWGDVQSYKAP